MIVHISSGNGVDEVCRAVWHFGVWLERGGYEFEVIEREIGSCKSCLKSLTISTSDIRFRELEGTHLWVSHSPFRAKHKRKNWYFSLKCYDEVASSIVDTSQIVYQSMKSSKKGGQHVNTTDSAIRAIYAPLNIEVISSDERSQHRNKQTALWRVIQKATELHTKATSQHRETRWQESKDIQRGCEIKRFVGDEFREEQNNASV